MHTLRTLPLLALSALFLAACNGSAPAPEASDDGGKMTMTMKDLVKLGKNYTCTFTDTDDDGNTTSGTVYVQGEKNFRGDFSMTMRGGQKQVSHMITNDRVSYMWSDSEKQGMMITLDEEDETVWDSDATEDEDAAFDEDMPVEMDCRKWSPDRSKFTKPSDKEFIDFQAQMDAMMKQTGGGAACSVCDQAPDAASKAECRKALGC